MSIRTEPHSVVSAETLAKWIEDQPERWWSVDGDPRLMGTVDFPCPSDELAPAIRAVGADLLVLQPNGFRGSQRKVGTAELAEFFAMSRNRFGSELFFAWSDAEVEWLLLEDEALVA